MTEIPTSLQERLDQRRHADSLRTLTLIDGIDFTSNDYIGLAGSVPLQQRIAQQLALAEPYRSGSTGSRLLSGNTSLAEELEEKIAAFHNAEAGLLFNSGYDANIGLFSAIASRHDTILYDELSHASVIDGIRLSHATAYKFFHNDVAHLESRLRQAKGDIFIAVESVYSMDGDMAPLEAIAALARRFHAYLIVDEAHATGIFGTEGRGLVNELQLESAVWARVHTFGKALGTHGAIVVGSSALQQYLINFARSFVYTTALPLHALVAIQCAYEEMQQAGEARKKLHMLIKYFQNAAQQYPGIDLLSSASPIQGIRIPGNEAVKKAAKALQSEGFNIHPILSPTVPPGTERLRICLHSFNSTAAVDQLLHLISRQSSTA
jgi:8-amino-7-oxononanoate synthase